MLRLVLCFIRFGLLVTPGHSWANEIRSPKKFTTKELPIYDITIRGLAYNHMTSMQPGNQADQDIFVFPVPYSLMPKLRLKITS